MNVTDLYGGQYMTSKDVPTSPWETTILKVKETRIRGRNGETQPRVLLALKGQRKALVLNKTNAMRIAQMHGEDTVSWPGKQLTLIVCDVEFQGEVIDGIRVQGADAPLDNGQQLPF